jgi:hypothetical protein
MDVSMRKPSGQEFVPFEETKTSDAIHDDPREVVG